MVGGLLSCVWLSWYPVIALHCNGHPYEAGGAARIAKFKQCIRWRLTRATHTGYVMADRRVTGLI